MKVTCNRKELGKALGTALKTITKSVIPILNNFLLIGENNKLTIIASNIESTTIIDFVDVVIEGEGKITVPAKLLTDLVNKLPAEQQTIELELKDNILYLSSGRSQYELNTVPADDYPVIPNNSKDYVYTFEIETLIDLIRKTKYAVSTEQHKPMLNGLHFNFLKNKLDIVSTDGYRMAIKTFVMENDKEHKITIHYKNINELEKFLISEKQGQVKLFIDKKILTAETEHKTFTCNLLCQDYPDYKKILPTTFKYETVFNKKEFQDAAERIAVIASERSNTLQIELTETECKLQAVAEDLAMGLEQVSFENKKFDTPIKITLNSIFLLEALKTMETEQITLKMNNNCNPIVFHPTGIELVDDTPIYLTMIMPIRTNV